MFLMGGVEKHLFIEFFCRSIWYHIIFLREVQEYIRLFELNPHIGWYTTVQKVILDEFRPSPWPITRIYIGITAYLGPFQIELLKYSLRPSMFSGTSWWPSTVIETQIFSNTMLMMTGSIPDWPSYFSYDCVAEGSRWCLDARRKLRWCTYLLFWR